MTKLLPKSKSHETLAARTCEAWAEDLQHVVDGLKTAAQEYRDGKGLKALATLHLCRWAMKRSFWWLDVALKDEERKGLTNTSKPPK